MKIWAALFALLTLFYMYHLHGYADRTLSTLSVSDLADIVFSGFLICNFSFRAFRIWDES
jgi:hypothetical protein